MEKDLYLNEWHAVARGICESTGSDSSLPHKLRTTVEHLQQKEINLTSDKVQLESQLNSALHVNMISAIVSIINITLTVGFESSRR